MAVKKGAAMLPETNILAYFADLDDPRVEKNRKHPLMNVITIAILSVICGADTWVDIERYGKAKRGSVSNSVEMEKDVKHD